MNHWLDRVTQSFAPIWTLKRQRARMAGELLARFYDAAAIGPRTAGWRRTSTDANAEIRGGLHRSREVAREVERNNAWMRSALRGIANRVVGWGLLPDIEGVPEPVKAKWKAWSETTACDADGRNIFAGLEKLVTRTVARDGEALVRRRWRRPEDVAAGLPIPLQLQVLEPDYLDTNKDAALPNGGRIIQGVEYSPIGARVGYWLYPEHPGASGGGITGMTFGSSQRIPAEEILHVFPSERAGQTRSLSQLAASILPAKDLDDYEDAALMKQKVAACLGLVTTDVDGSAPAIGQASPEHPDEDSLRPGMILNLAPGRAVSVVNPPTVSEHGPYTDSVLRKIAAGLPGVSFEDLTGNYSEVNFSSARMARLRAWEDIEDLRWLMLVPQFCDPVWSWFIQALAVGGLATTSAIASVEWTAAPMAMIEPDKEGLAYQRNLRIGAITWPEMVRERGYNPTRQLSQIVEWNKKFDAAGVILDSDPRKVSQQGQEQKDFAAQTSVPAPRPVAVPAGTAGSNGSRGADDNAMRDSWAADTVEGALALAQEAVALASRRLALSLQAAPPVHVENPVTIAPGAIQVNAPTTIREGAIQTHVQVPAPSPPPQITVEASPVTVDARTTFADGAVRVEPPQMAIAEGAISVDARTTIADGAVRVDVATSAPLPPPQITVEAPQVTVDARTSIAEGAIQAHVDVAPPPPADISVDARTTVTEGAVRVESPVTIAEGAIQAHVDVAPPPPAHVRVEGSTVNVSPPSVTIAEGAIRTELPITVADVVNVPAGRREIERDEKGRIKGITNEGVAGTIVNVERDADGRATAIDPAATTEPDPPASDEPAPET